MLRNAMTSYTCKQLFQLLSSLAQIKQNRDVYARVRPQLLSMNCAVNRSKSVTIFCSRHITTLHWDIIIQVRVYQYRRLQMSKYLLNIWKGLMCNILSCISFCFRRTGGTNWDVSEIQSCKIKLCRKFLNKTAE